MALGRRRSERQEAWVATTDLPRGPGHVFYDKRNGLFAEHDFDVRVGALCRPYFADRIGGRAIGARSASAGPPCERAVGYRLGAGSRRGDRTTAR